jgi:predicted nuclease with RNAse H fold
MSRPCWAGVDVGAAKGFDVAAIDEDGVVFCPRRIVEVQGVLDVVRDLKPRVVAVDSPASPAPAGERSRPDERKFKEAKISGIRYTPDEKGMAVNPGYYGWIFNGFRLYEALGDLEPRGVQAIECFPTATWTRLAGPRGSVSRARWSRKALEGRTLAGVPARTNQDARDAIGAALTARAYDLGETENFGRIVVPRSGISSAG